MIWFVDSEIGLSSIHLDRFWWSTCSDVFEENGHCSYVRLFDSHFSNNGKWYEDMILLALETFNFKSSFEWTCVWDIKSLFHFFILFGVGSRICSIENDVGLERFRLSFTVSFDVDSINNWFDEVILTMFYQFMWPNVANWFGLLNVNEVIESECNQNKCGTTYWYW